MPNDRGQGKIVNRQTPGVSARTRQTGNAFLTGFDTQPMTLWHLFSAAVIA
ncbi:hypothetical protein ABIE58_002056 [Roseovarius sp. MBR-78]|uniref:hypothetical protein n=1 Tax=Roseovarius sp. MBR-78 TaxID=3156460 RepID=UPI003397BC28